MAFRCICAADIHQGSNLFLSEARGRQCVPNCLMFILKLHQNGVAAIQKGDLHCIMYEGSHVYCKMNRHESGLLLPTALPTYFRYDNEYIKVIHKGVFSGLVQNNAYVDNKNIYSLESAFLYANTAFCSNFVYINQGFAVAIHFDGDHFFIFDSHARNSNGMSFPEGTCVLGTVSDLNDLICYLKQLALSINGNAYNYNDQFDLYSLAIQVISSKPRSGFMFVPKFVQHVQKRQADSRTSSAKRKKNEECCDTELLSSTFHQTVSVGPDYICTCCQQTFFKHSVSKWKPNNSNVQKYVTNTKSVDGYEWLCRYCLLFIKKGQTPPLWIHNGLNFPKKPDVLNLSELESRLVSPRIPFMQIRELPRGGQVSIKGNIVNVPADVSSTIKSLPRLMNDSETILLKLKRSLAYKHHVAFENIRPNKVIAAAKWLVENCELFQNEGISINETWEQEFQASLLNSNSEVNDDTMNNRSSDNWSEGDAFERSPTGNLDTVLQSFDFREFNQVLTVAPGEGNVPLGIFQDIHSEILSFPSIFCGIPRPVERLVPLHYSSICKWELRNMDRRVAMCMPNIFFKLKKLQIKQIRDKVTLAIRKCKLKGTTLTAADILQPGFVDKLTMQDDGYRVLKTIRGSPPYWEQAKRDLFAMIRQIGIPTWFCSFSAAETKWLPLLKSLNKFVHQTDLSSEDISKLTWKEKSELIKADPVTCARFFDFRVQTFIKDVLKHKSHPVGDVIDFFYRVEFQQRGSPHIHMLLWIKDAPLYGLQSNVDIAKFIDQYVTCASADSTSMTPLINYQTHRHAKTCRKQGKNICRFNFPIPPMSTTKILEPIDESSDKEMYNKSFDRIVNAINALHKNEAIETFNAFLASLNLTEEQYIMSVRSSLKSPKVFLKRSPKECRINNYNTALIRCWEANMDIQYVLDPYACVSYIVSYISKGQRGLSNLLQNACREAREEESDIRQQVRKIGNQFLSHVEVGAQEAVYLVLQMPLRRCTRDIVFIDTNSSAKRTVLLKSMSDLKEMKKHSKDIEMDSNIKRYKRRPHAFDHLCYADFISWYERINKKKKSKVRREVNGELPESDVEDGNDDDDDYDNIASLNESTCEDESTDIAFRDGTVLQKRSRQKFIYTNFPSINADKEEYYRTQVMLYTHWRDQELDILRGNTTYEDSFFELQEMILTKRSEYERISHDLNEIENAASEEQSSRHSEDEHQITNNCTDEAVLSEVYGCFDPGQVGQNCSENYDLGQDLGIGRKQILTSVLPSKEIDNERYFEMVQSLNKRQRQFFNTILYWMKTETEPIYTFLTGGAGVGKSVLLKTLYQALMKYFNHIRGVNPDSTKILLCAPTGKAAHNIGGSTIHSAFCLPVGKGFDFKPLDMQQLNTMRAHYHDIKLVFIDEISMVGRNMFNFINLRLQEITGTTKPFGGISIIAVGDLFQLKPVMDAWIFSQTFKTYCLQAIASHLWADLFSMFELTDIMRQKDDLRYAQLLNRLREGKLNKDDKAILQSRLITDSFVCDVPVRSLTHLFCTRLLCLQHNNEVLNELPLCQRVEIDAIDNISGTLSNTLMSTVLSHVPDDPNLTMGLCKTLRLGIGLPADVCLNIDTADGLTNGASCEVKMFDFRVSSSERCSIVWVEFSDPSVGIQWKSKYRHLYSTGISANWVPILETSRKFTLQYYNTYLVVRRQFPLQLSAAKTIHKSQGSTLQSAVLHFGNKKIDHIHYVGLSRISSLNGVCILMLNENKISISEGVVKEMERLRKNDRFPALMPDLGMFSSHVKVCFQNCRSFRRHFLSIKQECDLFKADVLAFVETRLSSPSVDIYELPNFTMFSTNSKESSHGMIVYHKNPTLIFKAMTVCGIECVLSLFLDIYTFCFIYCPARFSNIFNFSKLMQRLEEEVPSQSKIILMGDFNEDFFITKTVSNYLSQSCGFKQLINSCTTDYQSCLDHVYINFPHSYVHACGTFKSFYSDHKPLYLVLQDSNLPLAEISVIE